MTNRQPAPRPLWCLALAALAGLSALAAASPPSSPAREAGRAAPAREPARIDAGRRSFRTYCASCHGESAKGDGPLARDLKVRPSDLTALAKAHGGDFPADQVYRAIDGRAVVRGHGAGDMPVWGLNFQERGRDADQAREVRERIRDLLAYLRSIQAT
jgi:mono/diheme cytochrome c family protein